MGPPALGEARGTHLDLGYGGCEFWLRAERLRCLLVYFGTEGSHDLNEDTETTAPGGARWGQHTLWQTAPSTCGRRATNHENARSALAVGAD